jgi:hypothetical protein
MENTAMSNNFSINDKGEIIDGKDGEGRQARYENRGGCDVVTFGEPEGQPVSNLVPDGQKAPTQIRHEDGGYLEIGPGGSRYVGPMTTHETSRQGHGISGFMSTLSDHAGRKVTDWRKAIERPADYTVEFMNTKASVESMLRLGFLSISGSGEVEVNPRAILAGIGRR